MDWRGGDDERGTSYVGMTIALASWLMLFASLLLAYAVLRVQQPVWPPPGTAALPLPLALVNTVVLVASSLALIRAGRLQAEASPHGLPRWSAVACGLGITFLTLQALLWRFTLRSGIVPTGVFGSVFYALTVLHALHVLGGVVALGWLALRARQVAPARAHRLPLQPVAMYWHFVDLVWIALLLAFFVI